jgi:hypothetical protein
MVFPIHILVQHALPLLYPDVIRINAISCAMAGRQKVQRHQFYGLVDMVCHHLTHQINTDIIEF